MNGRRWIHSSPPAFTDRRPPGLGLSRGSCGFTFAEVLAAITFLGIVMPVAVRALTAADRLAVLAERKRVAAELGERKLNEIVIEEVWAFGESEGDFGEQHPRYRWVLAEEDWQEDGLRLLSVEVFFPSQGREWSVRLSTLVSEVPR